MWGAWERTGDAGDESALAWKETKTMRWQRGGFKVLAFCAVVAAAGTAHGQGGRQVTPQDMLNYKPKLQGIEYDLPTDPAAIAACKVEKVMNDRQKPVGYALRDGQGKLLRKFVVAHDHNHMDQWSYYQDGFEVYREDDLDGDRRLDECRWLNSGGSRVAKIEGNRVASWTRISPEEASRVLVQALVLEDADLLETVMAAPAELEQAGMPAAVVEKAKAGAANRAKALAALRKSLAGWDTRTIWNRFDGAYPRVIPADAAVGLKQDVTLYENAMIFPAVQGQGAQQAAARMAFLQVPDLVQLGPVWKFVGLPHAVDPEKPVMAAADGVRSQIFDRAEAGIVRDEAMEQALKALADFDAQNASAVQSGQKEKIARYQHDRIKLLRAVANTAKNPEDAINYNKQVVDSLFAAVRTGLFSEGKGMLEAVVAEGGKLGSYAAYRLIELDFAMKSDDPTANALANQKKWMSDLEGFLTRFASSDEAPDVLLQLASASEYNAEEDKAREYYTRLIDKYAGSEASKKATGALKRLALVGKPLSIRGAGLQGETIDSAQLAGKTVLVVFWASWAPPVRADLPELIKVYKKYHDRGLEIVGVSLDNDRAGLDSFLKDNPLPWPEIFEPGGMDSRLAVEFGIFSLPSMFLVDPSGKVVTSGLRTTTDLDRLIEKRLPGAQAGVDVDRK